MTLRCSSTSCASGGGTSTWRSSGSRSRPSFPSSCITASGAGGWRRTSTPSSTSARGRPWSRATFRSSRSCSTTSAACPRLSSSPDHSPPRRARRSGFSSTRVACSRCCSATRPTRSSTRSRPCAAWRRCGHLTYVSEGVAPGSFQLVVTPVRTRLGPRVEALMNSIADELREEGEKQGMQQGMQRGLRAGRIAIVLEQLQLKFGRLDDVATRRVDARRRAALSGDRRTPAEFRHLRRSWRVSVRDR